VFTAEWHLSIAGDVSDNDTDVTLTRLAVVCCVLMTNRWHPCSGRVRSWQSGETKSDVETRQNCRGSWRRRWRTEEVFPARLWNDMQQLCG